MTKNNTRIFNWTEGEKKNKKRGKNSQLINVIMLEEWSIIDEFAGMEYFNDSVYNLVQIA